MKPRNSHRPPRIPNLLERINLLAIPLLGSLLSTLTTRVSEANKIPMTTKNMVQQFIDEQSANLRTFSEISQEKLQELRKILADGLDDITHHPTTSDWKSYGKQIKHALTRNRVEERKRQQRIREFWIALGFGLGLTAMTIITIQMIRRRQLRRIANEEADHIQLTLEEEERPISTTSVAPNQDITTPIQTSETLQEAEIPSISTPPLTSEVYSTKSKPVDATHIGVVSNKLYYPATTPIDQITTKGTNSSDLIYFTSEEEAITRGYTPAQ